MAPFFLGLDGHADDDFARADEIFNLDAQLAACTGVRQDRHDRPHARLTARPGRLRSQRIETPSWAYGNSGTRFKVFAQQGVPRDPYEKLDDAAQVHRFTGVAPSVALHIPWDAVDDYADLASTRRPAACASARSTRTSSRTTTTCSAASPTPTRASGARPPTTSSRASTSWTRPGRATSSCGSPTAPTTPARTTSGRARTGSPRRCAEVYARLSQRAAHPVGVQAVRAGLLHDGRAGLGHVVRALPRARAAGDGLRRHRPPRAGHQHRVHRGDPHAGRAARRLRLQLAVLRRRRPDGRRPPTRSSCSGSCTRSSAAAGCDRTPRSPSCSTSATTSSRRSPARSAR